MVKANEWHEKIEKELETAREKGQVPASFIELVSELRIHQTELEMQNEELKQSQEELSELYSQYHELYDKAPVGYFTLDKDGIIRNVNIKGAELLQLNKSKIIGRGFSRFIPKDCENEYYSALSKAVKTGKIQNLELRLKRNENVINVYMEVVSLYKMKNESYRITIIDITKLKEKEKALYESESEYHGLFDSMEEAVQICELVFDDKGKPVDNIILNVNSAYEKHSGLKKEEVVGKRIKNILHVVEHVWLDRYGKVVREGKSMHFEEYNAGTERWFDVHAIPLGGNRFAAVFTDITERKKAEEISHESEKQLRSIFNNSLDALYGRNLITGRYNYFSPAIEQITGFSVREVLAMDQDGILERVHPDDLSKVMSEKMEVSSKVRQGTVDYRFLCKDNTYKWVSDRFKIIYDDKGEPIIREGNVRDITGRRQAEVDLAVSEEKYRTLHESMRDAFVSVTMDGQIIEFNDIFRNMLGYNNEELYNLTYVDLTPVKWHAMEAKIVEKQILPRDFSDVYEKEYIRKDGTVFPVELKTFLIRDKNGAPIYMWAIIRDITERKKAEEKLRQARDHLEEQVKKRTRELYNERQQLFDVLETLPIQVCLLSPDYHVVFANRAFRKMYGESQGLHCYDYCFGKKEPCEFCESFKPLETGKPHNWQVISPEGRIIDAYDFPFTDVDGSQLILEMDIDVTEQKQVEKELKSASKYNRNLIEASLDPLLTIGPDGKITDVNMATELVTGYSRNELIGTDFCTYFTEPEKARKGYQQVFLEGEVRNYPLKIKHKDEHVTPVLYNASVYKDVHDNVVGVFAAARDITERKKAEEQLKIVINELKHSNKELQSFAYITSHDLQEPLRTIASFTQLLERRYKGQLDSDADEFMDYIVGAAVRMKDMIQGLLEYSRIDTHNEPFKEFNSEEAVYQALNNLYSSIGECDAKITYENLPVIIGNEDQITRVFQNLVGNALKFHKEGVNPEIHISAQKTDDEYIFSVADNGIGMEKQYTGKIFEPFKRLHTIDEYKGTGIGLAVVKRIIEHHGGQICFESELGEGSTFYFILPVKPVIGGGAFS